MKAHPKYNIDTVVFYINPKRYSSIINCGGNHSYYFKELAHNEERRKDFTLKTGFKYKFSDKGLTWINGIAIVNANVFDDYMIHNGWFYVITYYDEGWTGIRGYDISSDNLDKLENLLLFNGILEKNIVIEDRYTDKSFSIKREDILTSLGREYGKNLKIIKGGIVKDHICVRWSRGEGNEEFCSICGKFMPYSRKGDKMPKTEKNPLEIEDVEDITEKETGDAANLVNNIVVPSLRHMLRPDAINAFMERTGKTEIAITINAIIQSLIKDKSETEFDCAKDASGQIKKNRFVWKGKEIAKSTLHDKIIKALYKIGFVKEKKGYYKINLKTGIKE